MFRLLFNHRTCASVATIISLLKSCIVPILNSILLGDIYKPIPKTKSTLLLAYFRVFRYLAI